MAGFSYHLMSLVMLLSFMQLFFSTPADSHRYPECRGVKSKQIFSEVDAVCQEIFKEDGVIENLNRCTKNCFNNDYFKKCIEALGWQGQMKELLTKAKQLRGSDS